MYHKYIDHFAPINLVLLVEIWPFGRCPHVSSAEIHVRTILMKTFQFRLVEIAHCNKQICMFYQFRLPWDQQTTSGYIGEMGYCLIKGSVYAFANAALLLFFISLCLYHQAFYRRFEQLVHQIDDVKENPSARIPYIYESIRFQNTIKE